MALILRPYHDGDADALWAMLEPVFRAGDTYTVDPEITRAAALEYWTGPGRHVFVAEDGGVVLGTYYVHPNQGGGGAHVCNCGYVTDPEARRRGVARAMLQHSLIEARRLGFRGMQYNFVVETNTRAIDIWRRAGFEVVGRLPGAFRHPARGFVDALVMYKDLTEEA